MKDTLAEQTAWNAAVAPVPDRVAHFTMLMDTQLALMPDNAARRRALVLELAKWERLFGSFLGMCGSPKYVAQPNEPDAWDYANLIAAISLRLERVRP